VEEALKIMKTFTSDDAARDLFEHRLEAEQVHEDLILTGVQKGIAIGKNEEMTKIARRMKKMGIDAGIIEQVTGLNPDNLT
jgi:predicted transposase/invertase (TIGR01784 family)